MAKTRRKAAANKDAAAAIYEARFLALVWQHPDTPAHVRGAIHALMFALFHRFAEYLKVNAPDALMVDEIYPYARLCDEKAAGAFRIVFDEICRDAPEVVDDIQHRADRGAMPRLPKAKGGAR